MTGGLNANDVYDRGELVEAVGRRSIRLMKRCFMTGKQCIFSSQVAECATREISLDNLKAFVIMPFRPNLETFYQWSLRPFLVKDYGLREGNVQRADEVRDIGYIVCEKICRKIQEADLVLADVSLRNANIFYEIGLSYGLERPIVLLQNGESNEALLQDRCFRQSLNLDGDRPISYPGIQELDITRHDHKLEKHITHPPRHKGQISELRISFLRVDRGNGGNENAGALRHDIVLNFNKVISAVVGVAMAEIRTHLLRCDDAKDKQPWESAAAAISDADWREFSSAKPIVVDGRGGFTDVATKIETSFCTIVDVTDNDPAACFWLGYCHARGLNVIPVYRLRSHEQGDVAAWGGADKTSRLAFDIRALWYAEYDSEKPYAFKAKMCEILQHLLQRDLPDRQKRAFWDRFPAERKLKVFTGAIHNKDLNREVVGDWDVRTVSELFSYLPSAREALAIELVTPLYSPEEAYRRSQDMGPMAAKDFIKAYNQSIDEQLKDSNAIVIASPDVNPVTEYLLHRIYNVTEPTEPFDDCPHPDFNGYVALKKLRRRSNPDDARAADPPRAQEGDRAGSDVKFRRLFYQQEEVDGNARGFGIHALHSFQEQGKLMEEYLSQDECKKPFSLLGHLVVARYPRNREDSNLVVLLNGVSGPATFALAQILTGGVFGRPEMKAKSENMLRQINEKLNQPGVLGVEAIVKVQITPPPDPIDQVGRARTFEDSRQVQDWDFIIPPKPIGAL